MTQAFLFEIESPRRPTHAARAGEVAASPVVGAAATKPRKRKTRPKVDPTAPGTYTASVDQQGRRVWTLTFPAPDRLMSVNHNPHWRVTRPVRKTYREAMYVHAKAAGLPTGLARVRVEFELRFPTGGRRDAGNYHANVAKPCVDALGPAIDTVRGGKPIKAVGYGLIADDTAEYLDGPFVRLGPSGKQPGAPFGEVVVVITDLSREVAA